MASPFALSLAASLPRAAASRASVTAGSAASSSCLAVGLKPFSTLRPTSFRRPLPTSSPALQARHLSLGWPFKKSEPDLIVPRAPADIDPTPSSAAGTTPPVVDPNPLPASPVAPSGAPTAPEPILSSSSAPNLPRPPRSFEVEPTGAEPIPAVDDAAGSVVNMETGILENGVDLRYLPEHIGDLRAQGLGSYWPSGLVQQIMEVIHVSTGVPWWGTIIIFTLLARAAMFPLILGGMRSGARLTRVQPEIKQYTEAIQAAPDHHTKARLSQEMRALMKRENVSIFAPLKAPLASLPVFLGTFWGLEAMCELPVWQFKVQGTAWFTDLTASDPTWILPVTSAIATWCIIHYGAAGTPPSAQAQANGELMNALRQFMKKAVFVGIPIFAGFKLPAAMPLIGGLGPAGFPTAVLLYWTVSNGFTALQSFAFSRPAVRAYLKLPLIPPVDRATAEAAVRSQRPLWKMVADGWSTAKKGADQKQNLKARSMQAVLTQKQANARSFQQQQRKQQQQPSAHARSEPFYEDAASAPAARSPTRTATPPPPSAAPTASSSEPVLQTARRQTTERERLLAQVKRKPAPPAASSLPKTK